MEKQQSNLTLKENYRERALEKSYKFIMKDGLFRGQIIHAPRMIREMGQNHDLGPLETLILGQAYLGTLIMALNLKDEGRIQLDIKCDGPLAGLSVEADSHGAVRGYLKQNPIPVEEGQNDLAAIIGSGTMTVTRLQDKMKQPHSSTIELRHGLLAKDIAQYYLESEQIPSFFDLSLDFNSKGELKGAGALFLQVLPGAKEEDIVALEEKALALPSLAEQYALGVQPPQYLEDNFRDFQPNVLKKTPLEFFCPCNRERFSKFLLQLNKKDQKDILKKGPFPLELACHNCNSRYSFKKEELEELLTPSKEK